MPLVEPETRYAKSDSVNIAYQVTGEGPPVVLVSGFVSHLELDWDEPRSAYFLERLSSFSTLVRFDKRGTGLSDRPGGLPDLETRMDDVRAVLDAEGIERAALFGYSEGGPMCVLFAATYPERTTAVVVYGSYAKRQDPDDDYPWAATREERAAYATEVERTWGEEGDLGKLAPHADEAFARWWGARGRAAASPGAARDLILVNSSIDVRDVLPAVRVPALVLHRTGDLDSQAAEGRYIAERIPGGRFVELAGDDHLPWIDSDQILDEVEEFLTGRPPRPRPRPGAGDRPLHRRGAFDGPGGGGRRPRVARAARAPRRARDRHRRAVRRHRRRHRGRRRARALRRPRALRAGRRRDHLGDARARPGGSRGRAHRRGGAHRRRNRRASPSTSARGSRRSPQPGQVLVSSTVKDLVAGSGLEFTDAGETELRGVPGSWRLYEAVAP